MKDVVLMSTVEFSTRKLVISKKHPKIKTKTIIKL